MRYKRPVLILFIAVASACWLRCSDDPVSGAASCVPSTSEVDFGTILLGTSYDRVFTIRNSGNTRKTGEIVIFDEECPFSVLLGGGRFELAPSQSRSIVVRFEPIAIGDVACEVSIGGDCGPVGLAGRGDVPAVCRVEPDSLAFGIVTGGDSSELQLTITNDGGSLLEGAALVPSGFPDFTVVGDSAYTLAGGESRKLSVRFQPSAEGRQAFTLKSGPDSCLDVAITGTGRFPPVCEIVPDSLDLGTVAVHEFGERTFVIRNVGGDTLGGSFLDPPQCPDLVVVGASEYALAAGESRTIRIRFAPTMEGPFECALDGGNELCPAVIVRAIGGPPSECVIDPVALDIGEVLVGQSTDLAFTITNGGGGTLAGTLIESCDDFSFIGNTTFSLGASESEGFILRFSPATAGARSCSIETGTLACGTITADGVGVPACNLTAEMIDFGEVAVGESVEETFTIENTGIEALTGNVSLDCAENFTIVAGGGAFTIDANQSRLVRIEYAPATEGTHNCSVGIGADCPAVALVGTAAAGALSCATDILPLIMKDCFGAGCHGTDAPTLTCKLIIDMHVTLSDPPRSRILRRPSGQTNSHGGFALGEAVSPDWEAESGASYARVLLWIQQGANP